MSPLMFSIIHAKTLLLLKLILFSLTTTSNSSGFKLKRLSEPYPFSSNHHRFVAQNPTNPSRSTLSGSEPILDDSNGSLNDSNHNKSVPIVLGVMSKCPDAQLCEGVFDKVLAQVGDMTDVSLSFIGDIRDSSPYGVDCLHGEPECRGNVQQLCYRKQFPQLEDWWSFVQCQNYAGLARVGEEMLARSCAKVHKHDWDKDVKPCADGIEGSQLLQSSVRHSQHVGIVKSCSILINHQLVCVHDGSWKDCSSGHEVPDFINLIQKEYERINEPKEDQSASAKIFVLETST